MSKQLDLVISLATDLSIASGNRHTDPSHIRNLLRRLSDEASKLDESDSKVFADWSLSSLEKTFAKCKAS